MSQKRGKAGQRKDRQENEAVQLSCGIKGGTAPNGVSWKGRLHWSILLAMFLIVLATVLVYRNTLHGPFIFDDEAAIADNPTIRDLWSLGKVLSPPKHGETVTGRPLLNWSFAVNYAVGGLNVRGYHLTNLVIHILNALLLFAVLRRTFLLPSVRDRWESVALAAAFSVAILWAIHPLQTESVTYVVQRAESLVALFYLLTLYCAVRGDEIADRALDASDKKTSGPILWYSVSFLACLCGMASKEVMVSAPLMVFLYDRTFLAGSFRESLRRRWKFYLALAATWLLLCWLVLDAKGRGGSAGFEAKISWWPYFCTQFGAIVRYLRLSFCPYPLTVDYGVPLAHGFSEIVPQAIVVVFLGLATVIALWRWPKVGFLGAWLFAILAPTSSIVPVATQTIAEHRMYLPLAGLMAFAVLACFYLAKHRVDAGKLPFQTARKYGCLILAAICLVMGGLTYERNQTYGNAIAIWQDTVDKHPENARGHNNLGMALARSGAWAKAVEQYRLALETALAHENPALIYNNYGTALIEQGQIEEAIAQYEKALQLKPDFAQAHYNYGNALARKSKYEDAAVQYQKAVDIRREYPDAYNNLGNVLLDAGRANDAIPAYENAIQCNPAYAEAHCNLGAALIDVGRVDEAIEHCRKALELKKNYNKAYNHLQTASSRQKELRQKLADQREKLLSHPEDVKLICDLAWALATNPNASLREGGEAVKLAGRAVELSQGGDPACLDVLGAAYAETGRYSEALDAAQKAKDLAVRQNNPTLADAISKRIHQYQNHRPMREEILLQSSRPGLE